jgi:RNA polymerase sigma-70 factor (ECF subfamily)
VTVSIDELQSITAQNKSDSTAFEAVFNAHWFRVYEVVYRIIGDPAEAEDLALEAFLKLHQRPPREGINLAGWLYRVATNLGLNALRAQHRRTSYETEAGKSILSQQTRLTPDAAVEQAEERRRVRQVLAKMKKRPAKILILRHSGFSYAEIAAAIGIADSSVGTLLARAEREFERRYRAAEKIHE